MRTYALSVKFVTFAKLNKRTSKSKMRALHTTILHTTIILALIHTATIAAPARVAINPPKESLQQDGDILKVYTISNKEDSLLLRQKCTDFTPDELSSAEFAHFAAGWRWDSRSTSGALKESGSRTTIRQRGPALHSLSQHQHSSIPWRSCTWS